MESNNNTVETRIESLEAWQERALLVFNKLREAMEEIEVLHVEIATLRKAVAHGAPVKSQVPELKAFNGERDMKILENFLWDIEAYFRATHTLEKEKVNLVSMFLAGDAKLWWRTMYACSGDDKIETWEDLSKELRT